MDFQTSSALVVVIASIAAYYYQHALHQEQLDSLWIGKVEAAVPVYDYGAADIDGAHAKGEPFVVHNWPLGADTSHESFIDTSETVDALIGLDNIFVNFNHEMHEQIVGDVPYDRSKERFRVTGVVQEHMPFKAFISRARTLRKRVSVCKLDAESVSIYIAAPVLEVCIAAVLDGLPGHSSAAALRSRPQYTIANQRRKANRTLSPVGAKAAPYISSCACVRAIVTNHIIKSAPFSESTSRCAHDQRIGQHACRASSWRCDIYLLTGFTLFRFTGPKLQRRWPTGGEMRRMQQSVQYASRVRWKRHKQKLSIIVTLRSYFAGLIDDRVLVELLHDRYAWLKNPMRGRLIPMQQL